MPPTDTPSLHPRIVWPALLVCIAAGFALRITDLDLALFNADEAQLAHRATLAGSLGPRTWAEYFQFFPRHGILTSFGFHNPPLLIYLTTPFFALVRDPRFAMAGFALAGTAAIWLTALTAGRLWGRGAAAIAGILVAFSPNAIEHSRRLWGHDTIIFWSALCCYGAVRSIQSGRSRWLWLSMGAAAAAQACHLSGALLWTVPVGALLCFRPSDWKRSVGVGLAITALIYVPWVLQDAFQNGFGELRMILGLASGLDAGPSYRTPLPPVLCWLALLADGFHSDSLLYLFPRFSIQSPWFAMLSLETRGGLAALGVAGLLVLLRVAMQSRSNDAEPEARWGLVLAASALAPMLVFSILPVTSVPAYQLPAFIPLALATTFAVIRAPIASAKQRLPLGLAFALLVAFYGVTHTVQARSLLERSTDSVSATLGDKTGLLRHVISNGVPLGDYAITQEGRAYEEGIDFWIIYLHFQLTDSAQLPTDPGTRTLFVIHDTKVYMEPELRQRLARKPQRIFGPLRVTRLDGDEAVAWRQMTRNSASARGRKSENQTRTERP